MQVQSKLNYFNVWQVHSTDSQEPVVGHSDGQLAAVGGHGGGEVPLVAADLNQGRAGALPQQSARVTVPRGVGDELHEAVPTTHQELFFGCRGV